MFFQKIIDADEKPEMTLQNEMLRLSGTHLDKVPDQKTGQTGTRPG